LQYNLHLH